jgi:biotin carboxyl carrier protein
MRTEWRDGEHARSAEVTAEGGSRFRVSVDGAAIEVSATRLPDGRIALETPAGNFTMCVTASGKRRFVRVGALEFVLDLEPAGRRRSAGTAGGSLEAPMPGVVTRVLVSAGEPVTQGQALLALEAMKMEHVIRAPRAGRVKSVHARAGEMVTGGATLVELEPDEPTPA